AHHPLCKRRGIRRSQASGLRTGIPARGERTAGAQFLSCRGRGRMTNPAPGVTTITLPMPWELESVNVHLVQLDEGYLLVDSGIATEECFESFEDALGKLKVKWTDIRLLCLTHLHPDHIGLSWKILGLSSARLLMHRAEADYLALVARESRAPFFNQAMVA